MAEDLLSYDIASQRSKPGKMTVFARVRLVTVTGWPTVLMTFKIPV